MALQTYDTKREMVTTSTSSTISAQSGHPLRPAFELAVPITQGTLRERTFMASIAAWIFPPHNVPVERAVALRSRRPSSDPSTVGEAFSWDRAAVVSGLCLKRYL